ncbi:ABC transporter substrate-binding protein [Staphylococcus simiae]|uniref:ABC transporter substrate-binding protein n=1 Tax=Staphylococcus simiae TaxID=308354 RepID=UPI001A95A885|nr:ABC transporter substrate-binding protein [Staphylococcus simiae]QSY54958.1 ABC transporter substrate-binding protein [Staphylococcus simiae]
MKKLIVLIFCLLLFLAACSNGSQNNDSKNNKDQSDNSKKETTFTTDDGQKVKVPQHPKRIVVLHPSYVGALVKFGHKPVAVPKFIEQNKVLKDATQDIKKIDNTSVEQVVKEKPDLIITTSEDKNFNKLKKIAPTVTFNANKSSYKDTTRKLAQLVNEKSKANAWLKKWEQQLASDKKELQPLIKGKTASVLQQTPKGIMAFSDHMGRGTEIIYDGYGMKQPSPLEKATQTKFATRINEEQFQDYIGDFAIIAQQGDKQPPFEQTNYWKNLTTVKKNHVITFDVSETQYNDPISLEKQREIFYKALKDMK